jgi:ParB-like chromosome segregation protein Spo0J
MAKYEVTHTCGHEVTVDMIGRNREWRLERMAEYPCVSCRREERAAMNAERVLALLGSNALPSLEAVSDKQREEIVDGFHRHRVGKEVEIIRKRVHGYLPVTRVNEDRAGIDARIAATIRHNRARGEHSVAGMVNIVRMLHVQGWENEKIEKELGMSADEVLRLERITGLRALFADRQFSEAWEPAKGGAARDPLSPRGERMMEEIIDDE